MPDMLLEALRLQAMGFAVHWLRPASKIPVAEGWATAPVMSAEDLRATYRPGMNLGFRPGKWSAVKGREVCVLDIDLRGGERYANEAYAAAAGMLDGLFTPNVFTGSVVGRHQYLLFPIGQSPAKAATTLRQSDVWADASGTPCAIGTSGAKPAWVIELLSTGKNVVMPPSIHPDTNKPYHWAP